MRVRFVMISCLAVVLSSCGPSEDTLQQIPLWGRWEEIFAETEDAVQATALTVRSNAPRGGDRVVEGFWDGASVWKVRFMPDEPGKWSYRTVAVPAVPRLDGRTRSFEVTPAEATNSRFLKHGAISVPENRRYLAHAGSEPFFWLADTARNGAMMSADRDWDLYLADRVAKGISAIQCVGVRRTDSRSEDVASSRLSTASRTRPRSL